MRKERTLLILGVWVVVLAFMGFPDSWHKLLFALTGVALIYLAYLFYRQAKARLSKDESRMHSYVDNIGSGE
jgi:predicted membrane-bound mannosyltransferase